MKKHFLQKKTIGAWIQLDSLTSLKIIDNKKFDWLCFDLEHGCTGLRNITKYINVINRNNKLIFARISILEINLIPFLFDQGIDGIIIANIQTLEDIIKVYKLSNYPPKGNRGLGYSNSNQFNFDRLNIKIKPLIIPIIENDIALKNIDKIINKKFIDAVFIGPVDLSISIQNKIDLESPKFIKAEKKIINQCKKNKIQVGTHILFDDKELIKKYQDKGFGFIAYTTDTFILSKYYNL